VTIDMHCHLDLYPDPHQVAAQCRLNGTYILSITTTPKAWAGTSKLAANNSRIRTALGLHPQLAHERHSELELFDQLLPNAKYVGEIGLDGGKGFKEHWAVQLKVFRHALTSINRAGGRIMSIHSRVSAEAVLEELKSTSGIPLLHWFSGTRRQLKQAVDMGCWFSTGPAMLSTKKGAELASLIPKNRLLTETDGPFGKYQHKSLLPWDVDIAVKQISNIWSVPESEVTHQLMSNFRTLVSNG